MSEHCPTCGQEVETRRIITTRKELLSLLRQREDREIYRSTDGRWHYTNSGPDRHAIDAALVAELVASRVLRPSYVGSTEMYGLGPTVDLDATLAMRKATGDRSRTVFAA